MEACLTKLLAVYFKDLDKLGPGTGHFNHNLKQPKFMLHPGHVDVYLKCYFLAGGSLLALNSLLQLEEDIVYTSE